MTTTSIEWTRGADGSKGQTWNPVVGCAIASPGCHHCYAATMTRRLEAMGQADYTGLTTDKHFNGVVRCLPHKLDIPLKRRKPTTYFVNSMSDLFHEDVPDAFIAAVFGVMAASPKHTFQVLTKRAQRMHDWMQKMTDAGGLGVYIRSNAGRDALRGVFSAVTKIEMVNDELQRHRDDPWMQVMNGAACNYGKAPLFNVWLGVSCEDQKRADERIPWLLKTPAAVRFLSCEPLLGPIDLRNLSVPGTPSDAFIRPVHECRSIDALEGMSHHPLGTGALGFRCPKVDWVIVGGESGPGSRACRSEWVLSIVNQCKRAGVPCFVKQLGAKPENYTDEVMRGLRDRKGGSIDEWPKMLQVRQMPNQEQVA